MATDLLPADASTKKTTCEISPELESPASASPGPGGAGQGSANVTDVESILPQTRNLSAVASDLIQLTKPRIVVMILVTTVATAIVGAAGLVPIVDLFWLLIGTAAVAGSAGSANQVWERVIDCRMTRTATRPLPAGRLGVATATIYTAVLGILGSALLAGQFGYVPALVGIVTWLLYVLIYTPMKTRTAWNTTVGAIAGALPVLIGYTATGGTLSDLTGWLLVGVLVAWQYPHFMSIAWMYRRQYAEAGFRMTTTVEPTGRSAAWQSVSGSIALIFCGIALCFMTDDSWRGWIASAGVIAATLPMLRSSLAFMAEPDDTQARRLLRSSLLVLPTVLLIVTLRVFW